MKLYTDYLPFDTDDFLTDPPFREWISRPTPEMTAYWRGLLQTHPHLRSPFEQARLLAQAMQVTWTPFSDVYTDSLYQQLLTAIPIHPTAVRVFQPVPRWLYTSAAAVLLVTGLWSYLYFFQGQTIQTGNAEVRTVTLYDGSVVTLNANSQLRLPSRMNWHQQRQLWLTGEGYFAVRRQPGGKATLLRKFIVHTHRDDIVVLGTHFAVYTRSRRTQILLEEGRISLTDPRTQQTVTMQPGQLVSYTDQQPLHEINQLSAARQQPLTAWRENRLIFDTVSMDELSRRFEEVYGLQLILKNEAFTGQAFRGELPVDDLEKALLIIAETFGLKPVQQQNRVYFVEP